MINGYYSATGAMVTQFNKLDTVSNNLANVNTLGYKRDNVVVGDFERVYQEMRDVLPIKNHTKEGAKFLNRSINRVPHIVENYIDFSPGVVKKTGNSLDFALRRGDLFFLADTPNGVRMTQNGSFTINQDGVLTTKEGYKVLPGDFLTTNIREISVPPNSTLTADKNGKLYADGEPISQFFIAQVKNLKNVQKEGDNLLKIDDIEENILQAPDGDYIQQGFLQGSNISAVKEMVSLIEVNRMVEMYQKVMTSHMDELQKEAITKLASTKA